jgi:hypothetical protein
MKINHYFKKWRLRQNILTATVLVITMLSLSTYAESKQAIIFISPDLTGSQEDWNYVSNIRYEIAFYESQGYSIIVATGTEKTITEAILNRNTNAITFIGHGGLGSGRKEGASQPTLIFDAQTWRLTIGSKLLEKYLAENYSQEAAIAKAQRETENFGFDYVRNYSCFSLCNTTIADLFVKPGGKYWGTPTYYSAMPLGAVFNMSDFWLTEYNRPLEEPEDIDTESTESLFRKCQPSWGPEPPEKLGLTAKCHIVWPPYAPGLNGYEDGSRIWIWNGQWQKFLVKSGQGFLEYSCVAPGKPLIRYERDKDANGAISEVHRLDGKKQWNGSTVDLKTSQKGRYYLIWN